MKKYGYIEIDVEVVVDPNYPQFDALTIYKELIGQQLVVIESKVYYEAYYHILKQLQSIKELPFERMIVDADPRAVDIPYYCDNEIVQKKVDDKILEYTLD